MNTEKSNLLAAIGILQAELATTAAALNAAIDGATDVNRPRVGQFVDLESLLEYAEKMSK